MLGFVAPCTYTPAFLPWFRSLSPLALVLKRKSRQGCHLRVVLATSVGSAVSVECTLALPCPAAHPCSLCLLLYHLVLLSITRGRMTCIHTVPSTGGLRFIRKQQGENICDRITRVIGDDRGLYIKIKVNDQAWKFHLRKPLSTNIWTRQSVVI